MNKEKSTHILKRKNPKFILRPDTGTLQLQYSYKGKWFRVNSHVKAEKSEWDEASQWLKGDRREDNLIITSMLDRLMQIIFNYKLHNEGKPTVEYIREQYVEKRDKTSIMNLYDEYVKKKEQELVNANIHLGMKSKLEIFCQSKGYTGIESIDTKFKDEFTEYLTRSGLQNITVKKRIKILKEFLNWCEKKDINVNKDIDWKVDLKVNKSGSNIYILTDKEFESLKKKELEPRLDRVRDVYLLGCSTGLRYSDLVRLDNQHVKNGYIEIVTQKTGDFVRIPLNELAQSIMNKYNNFPPRISDQKLNKYLYELFRLMEITDKVSTTEWRGNKRRYMEYDRCDLLSIHTSRKFFITYCISMGVTHDAIMEWTGHSNLKVFYDYVKKGKTGEEQMKEIFKL